MLGNDETPFLQVHGSISEQIEDGNETIKFRYLTNYHQSKLAFCDDGCMVLWLRKQQSAKEFRLRPQADEIENVIHT